MNMLKTILTYSITILIALSLLSLWGFYSAIRPTKIISAISPTDFHIPFEDINFYTKDQMLIKGWFIPAKNATKKTIILLHGYPADKGDILPTRLFLHNDFNLLLFDFRYFGLSGGSYTTIGKNEVLDVLAAINYLKQRNITSIGIWGISLGSAVALMAAEQSTTIKAVVAESGYARLDWMAEEYYRIPGLNYPLTLLTRLWAWIFLNYDLSSVSPANSAKKLTIPVLLIHSKQDQVISFRHAELLKQALAQNPNVETLILDNTQHGELFKDYQQVINHFFQQALK